ncbi:hypothetical protein Golax_014017 [Gossypium laxum]|uniref:Auxin-responsive protein n=1 Tax=Gossypium laxum TaxID=34288 RepID=A0A7J8ZTN5_9ROSI|nr:hypothetical protein [Gossypium laxum]
MRRAISYCSSSIGSSNHFDSSSTATAASSSSQRDHNTDLSLGLSISTSPLYARKQRSPIKPLLRLELAEQDECNSATFYVKVYMEGIPIAEVNGDHFEEYHVLTYEDKEGDWMMVGDVPWHTPQLKLFYLCMYCRMFLSVVRRLKISRSSAEL